MFSLKLYDIVEILWAGFASMGAQLSYPVVDLAGKVAVITGGNAGIGYETAKALALMGAQTILACRSEEKATAAIDRLKQEASTEFPDRRVAVEFMPLDLSSFQSTREFAAAFRGRNLPLHVLVNNAGVAWLQQKTLTADGYESQFQVNHLSPFLLTLELLPLVLQTASNSGDGRVVYVSSRVHHRAVWDPQNMNGEQSYHPFTFYNNSKLYNVMTAYALQRRLKEVGVTVSALHPGVINTELFRHWDERWYLSVAARVLKLGLRNTKDGAATTINCAVNPELKSQQCIYYSDCQPTPATDTARDEQLQEQLWEISVKAVREHLSPEILEQYGSAHKTNQSAKSEGPSVMKSGTDGQEESS